MIKFPPDRSPVIWDIYDGIKISTLIIAIRVINVFVKKGAQTNQILNTSKTLKWNYSNFDDNLDHMESSRWQFDDHMYVNHFYNLFRKLQNICGLLRNYIQYQVIYIYIYIYIYICVCVCVCVCVLQQEVALPNWWVWIQPILISFMPATMQICEV